VSCRGFTRNGSGLDYCVMRLHKLLHISDELATNSNNKNIRDLYRGINYRGFTNIEVT
jgi:hypothetical protein